MKNLPSPHGHWVLTPESFDGLLRWLDSDREQAGVRYEQIRANLLKNFTRYGCPVPEDLADETINRVAKKLPDIEPTYAGDPALYFYAVAYNIFREYLRKPVAVPLPEVELSAQSPPPDRAIDEEELLDSCLRHCMNNLPPRHREVISRYYEGEKRVKINLRKELASKQGLTPAALRLLAQRIRDNLKKCILACLERGRVGVPRDSMPAPSRSA